MRKTIYCALLIDFVIMILNIVELVHEGLFRDIYATVKIKDEVTYFFWISIFLTVIIFFSLLLFLLRQKQQQINRIVTNSIVAALLLLIVANVFFGQNYYTVVKKYRFEEPEEQDYILSEYFRGISLDELRRDIMSDSEILIYIGREDCKECIEFENKFENILREYYTEISTYYTSLDREGNRRDEMYELLDEYNIGSVPVVVLVQNSKVLKIWNNPVEELDGIKDYL